MTDQATMLSTAAGRYDRSPRSATYWIPQPRRWAALINGKTRREHNESAQPPLTDVQTDSGDFAFGSKCEILIPSGCLPLGPRTRTLLDAVGTSHLCQKRTHASQQAWFTSSEAALGSRDP
jgi:hypothetical protein